MPSRLASPFTRSWAYQRHTLTWALPLLAVLFFSLNSCSPGVGEDVVRAEASAEGFHTLYNAGDVDSIYVNTTDGFRKRTSKRSFQFLVDRMRSQLGLLTNTRVRAWQQNLFEPSTMYVEYLSNFQRGSAIELFKYRLTVHGTLLASYGVRPQSR